MSNLDVQMRQIKKPLVSFAFQIPERTADAMQDGVYLYKY